MILEIILVVFSSVVQCEALYVAAKCVEVISYLGDTLQNCHLHVMANHALNMPVIGIPSTLEFVLPKIVYDGVKSTTIGIDQLKVKGLECSYSVVCLESLPETSEKGELSYFTGRIREGIERKTVEDEPTILYARERYAVLVLSGERSSFTTLRNSINQDYKANTDVAIAALFVFKNGTTAASIFCWNCLEGFTSHNILLLLDRKTFRIALERSTLK